MFKMFMRMPHWGKAVVVLSFLALFAIYPEKNPLYAYPSAWWNGPMEVKVKDALNTNDAAGKYGVQLIMEAGNGDVERMLNVNQEWLFWKWDSLELQNRLATAEVKNEVRFVWATSTRLSLPFQMSLNYNLIDVGTSAYWGYTWGLPRVILVPILYLVLGTAFYLLVIVRFIINPIHTGLDKFSAWRNNKG